MKRERIHAIFLFSFFKDVFEKRTGRTGRTGVKAHVRGKEVGMKEKIYINGNFFFGKTF